MALTNSNVFSQSYSILKNFLNTNISDPKNRYKKQWIHATLPDITNHQFDGYPFITLDVDTSEDMKSLDRSTSNKTVRILLGVYSDDPSEVDSISDQIHSKFKDVTLTDSLSEFKSITLGSSPFDYDLIGGKKISRRLIGMIGVTRL